jgi:hypothetical protein
MFKKIKKYNLNILASFLFLAQILFSVKVGSKIKFESFITSSPPSNAEIILYGIGDKSFAYRFFSQKLQMMGDSYGTVIPLEKYDFKKLILWFNKVQEIEPKSRYLPYIAGFYYAFSQNKNQSKYVIDFLIDRFNSNPENNWEWLLHAVYLTKHRLEDKKLENEIINKINSLGDIVPKWGKIMLALILIKDDESCESVRIINSFTYEDLNEISKFMGQESKNNNIFVLLKNRINKMISDPELVRFCLK